MKKPRVKISIKNKRRLIYSVVMVIVPLCVLIGLTLGWFVVISTNEVDGLQFQHSSDVYIIYQSEDKDGDGIPDEENGEVIYNPVLGDGILIEYVYPKHSTAFRMELSTGNKDATVIGYLNSVSPPEEQYMGDAPDPLPDPPVDVADVLHIRFNRPRTDGGFDEIDAPLSSLFIEGTRNIALMEGVNIPADTVYTLDYVIYMHEDAGNEYQSMRLLVEEAVFRTQH